MIKISNKTLHKVLFPIIAKKQLFIDSIRLAFVIDASACRHAGRRHHHRNITITQLQTHSGHGLPQLVAVDVAVVVLVERHEQRPEVAARQLVLGRRCERRQAAVHHLAELVEVDQTVACIQPTANGVVWTSILYTQEMACPPQSFRPATRMTRQTYSSSAVFTLQARQTAASVLECARRKFSIFQGE